MRKIFLLGWLCSQLTFTVATAQVSPQALQSWKNDKFSMFIHFGVYSVLGGVWDGQPVTRGYSEQIQAHAGIYSDVYERVAGRFDPVHWNPDSVALLAKAAGMRSIVITSKHHDGFCLFHSAYTDFNMVDATPYQKDIIKGLADACRRHGLKFGVYFSLIDWHYPQAYPISSNNSDPITPQHHAYNKEQVTELLTHYGPISEIWFDMGSLTVQQSRELYALVHKLQPDCMVSGRLGNDMGDFSVMGDNDYPDYKIFTPWQTPASMFDDTWGYRSWEKRGDPAQKAHEKLVSLIKVVSRGGNYLLNIGPEGDGSIVPFEKEVLLDMGTWLHQNGEAVYNTHANPFPETFDWGEVTANTNNLYLHLLKMPADHRLQLPGLSGRIKSATVLGDPALHLRIEQKKGAYAVVLPDTFTLNEQIPVIDIAFEDGYKIAPDHVLQPQEKQGGFLLNNQNATPHYTISGVDYDSYYRSVAENSWIISSRRSTSCEAFFSYTEEEKGKKIMLTVNGQQDPVTLDNGQSVELPGTAGIDFGNIYLNGTHWSGINGTNGPVKDVDPAQLWPGNGDKAWEQKQDWKAEDIHYLPADMDQSWYVLQNIRSESDRKLLVRITSGDGIEVFLNGTLLFIHNNPERKDKMKDVVLLPLQKGENQLVIKLYNRFKKKTPFALDYSIPQVLYRQPLPAIMLQKGLNNINWKLDHPFSPRMDMTLPNLSLHISP